MTVPAEASHPPPPATAPRRNDQRNDRRIVLNTGALVASSLWRIGISFVLQMVIAGLLGAQGLGQYATALAWLNVCQILSELGLPQLLVRDLARFPARRRTSFGTALPLQIGAALLIWGAVYGLTGLLPYQPETRLALILITASLPFFAVTSACETLFQANERMELVMAVEMAINTLIVVASLLIVWQGGGVVALCGVLVITQAISALLCLWLVRREGLLGGADSAMEVGVMEGDTHRPRLIDFLRSARPFYGLALANVLLHRLDILLLSIFAGETITGIYSAAYLIVRVLFILAQTWWQSLYPTLSRLRVQGREQYGRLAAISIRYGLMAFLPVAALSGSGAVWLLGIVYQGADQSAAVAAYQVLIWAAPLFLVATYGVNLLLIEHRPQGSLLIAGTHIVATLSLLPLLTAQWQALGAAVAMIGAISASAAVGLLLLRRMDVRAGLPRRLPLLLVATLAGVLLQVWLDRFLLAPGFWPLSTAASLLLYLALIWWGGILSATDFALFRKALRP